jgi:hypothetical protein
METRPAQDPAAASLAQPGQPAQPPAASQPAQLALALVDTPAGQRLAVQLTLMLGADEAKAFGAAVTDIAASMSTSGLVVANGVLSP